MKLAFALLVFLASLPCARSQSPVAQEILRRFEAARPTFEQLAFYSLDWAPSLTEARVRARAEGRPIFFIWLTNISAPTDFFSGHC